MSTEPRRGRWLPLVYYYLATIVGLSFLLAGLIGGLNGLVTAMFPRTADEYIYSEPPFNDSGDPVEESAAEKEQREAEAFDQARNGGFAAGLRGLITAIVGAPVFFWHLRQARRREPEWLGASPPKDAAA